MRNFRLTPLRAGAATLLYVALWQAAVYAIGGATLGLGLAGLYGIGLAWLLGGPVPKDLLQRMKREPSALGTLASSMAARERYADEDFWLRYRQRLAARSGPDESWWVGYFSDPAHQVQLVLTPGGP